MEIGISKQDSSPDQFPIQNLNSQPITNQKSNLRLALGVVLLLVIVGVGAYLLGLRKNKTNVSSQTNVATKTMPTPNQTVIETNFKNKIVYTYNGDLWTINADSSEKKQLTYYGYNYKPQWSPNGLKIAYASIPQSIVNKGKYQAGCSSFRNIWIINSDGTEPVQVTNSEASRGEPSWSPDANKIVFVENEKVIIYNLASKSKTTIANDVYNAANPDTCGLGGRFEASVSWSPKEDSILLEPGNPAHTAFLISATDGKVIKPIDNFGVDFGVWSPDGSKIAYITRTSIQSIVVLSVLNGKKETYKTFEDRAADLYWSPDSKEILYDGSGGSLLVDDFPMQMNAAHILNLLTKSDRIVPDNALRRFIEQEKDLGLRSLTSDTNGWSPNGKFILVGISAEERTKPSSETSFVTQINLVDVQTGKIVKTLMESRRTYDDINAGTLDYRDISFSPK